MLAASAAMLVGASPADAQIGPQCYVVAQGNSFSAQGASTCYYVVVTDGSNNGVWNKVCEGYDRSFSCDNLRAGDYQVQAYRTNPWSRESLNTLPIGAPDSGNTCTELFASVGNIGGGDSDRSCYYVVHAPGWTRVVCEGHRFFPIGCGGRFGELPAGTYHVDVYDVTTNPWQLIRTDSPFIG